MEPRNPVRPDFDRARDIISEQVRQLNDNQRTSYDQMQRQHEQDLAKKQVLADKTRQQLDEARDKHRNKLTYELKPPHQLRVKTPVSQLANRLIAQDKEYRELRNKFNEEKIKFLANAKLERGKPATRSTGQEFNRATLLHRPVTSSNQKNRDNATLLHRSGSKPEQDRDSPARLHRSVPEKDKQDNKDKGRDLRGR